MDIFLQFDAELKQRSEIPAELKSTLKLLSVKLFSYIWPHCIPTDLHTANSSLS